MASQARGWIYRVKLGKKESVMPTPDLSSPDFLREKAEGCVALSYQINDPKKQVAILKLASWWMRLAEQYINKSHPDTK